MSEAGPWHSIRLRRGDEWVDELGSWIELDIKFPPNPSLKSHKFTARMIIVRSASSN